MARTVTLAQLITAVERECDLPVLTADTYVTRAEATSYLNDEIQQLTGVLAEIFPAGYFDTSATIPTVANTSTVALPAGFYQARRLYHSHSSRLYPLEEWRDERQVLDLTPRSWSAGTRIRYRLKAETIELDPIPAGVYSLRLDYVPVLADLSDDADTFDGRIGWDRWCVLGAAIRVMSRQEQDWQDKAAERARIEQAIRTQAPQRDGARIERVRNVYGRARYEADCDREGSWNR